MGMLNIITKWVWIYCEFIHAPFQKCTAGLQHTVVVVPLKHTVLCSRPHWGVSQAEWHQNSHTGGLVSAKIQRATRKFVVPPQYEFPDSFWDVIFQGFQVTFQGTLLFMEVLYLLSWASCFCASSPLRAWSYMNRLLTKPVSPLIGKGLRVSYIYLPLTTMWPQLLSLFLLHFLYPNMEIIIFPS